MEQTHSLGIQIHYNCLFALDSGHVCAPGIKLTTFARYSMNHIFIDKKMHVYKYCGVHRQGVFDAKRYLLKRIETEDGFDWASVGVFEVVGISRLSEKINARDVRGRAIICRDKKRMITWTHDMQHM